VLSVPQHLPAQVSYTVVLGHKVIPPLLNFRVSSLVKCRAGSNPLNSTSEVKADHNASKYDFSTIHEKGEK